MYRLFRIPLGLLALALIAQPVFSAVPSTNLDDPVSPNAQPEVRSLLDYLNSVSGTSILSGQQEAIDWFGKSNDTDFTTIQTISGKLPAIRGFDFIFLNNPTDVDSAGNPLQKIPDLVTAWTKRGGIATICWHWNAGTPRKAFYTADSDFDLQRALDDVNSADHKQFITDMDQVAGELKKLSDAHIPVIWRPFHEVNGNAGPTGGSGAWFWWGNKGPEVFKRAWRFMFDRFTRVHKLTNLIWNYNPCDTSGAMTTWYPGDEYVDVASFDFYDSYSSSTATTYQRLRTIVRDRKVVTMSENGRIPDPDVIFPLGLTPTWFLTWNGFLTADKGNTEALIKKVFQDPRVITLDKLPDVYHRTGPAPGIHVQPASAVVGTGARVALAVTPKGWAPFSYQWKKNGVMIPDARSSTYTIASTSATDAAVYSVVVTSAGGSVESAAATVSVGSDPQVKPTGTLTALSTLSYVGTVDDVLIGGFIIGGNGSKRLLIRGIGPALVSQGVAGSLDNPALELTTLSGTTIARNNEWWANDNASEIAQASITYGSPLPADSLDAAMIVTLSPGIYTAIVRGAGFGTGVGMVEIVDIDKDSTAKLTAISSRGRIGTNGQAMIGGFFTEGSNRKLLVQAVGPSMAAPGVIADPQVTLTRFPGAIKVLENDDWYTDPVNRQAVIEAHTLGGSPLGVTTNGVVNLNTKDSAFVVSQPGAAFTAVSTAKGNANGVVLIEVYDITQ